MSKKLFLSLFTLVFLLKAATALTVDVPAKGNECFYEELEQGEKLTLTYQVKSGSNYEIDFYITNPQNGVVVSNSKKEQGSFTVSAELAGRYTYCFSNVVSGDSDKSVSFNANKNQKINVADENGEDPLRLEIEELADSIFDIKAQQELLVARERRHRDTVESTNDRVKWWSIAQIGLLIGVCFWQVHYLKHFFSAKRSV